MKKSYLQFAFIFPVLFILLNCPDKSDISSSRIQINRASILEVAPVQTTTAAFMEIENHSSDEDFLIGAETEIAEVCEIHEMVNEGEMMRMKKRDSVAIPGGETVLLRRGGLHLMLIDLKREIHDGEVIPLKLKFKNAEDIQIKIPVKSFDKIN
ncbi:MAG: copper chaperone PCu(A)C [Spirochaetia bacterium]|nr:copper chaperone PCu(A)C [Spirochaetia bacterium]